ncbi:MAG TPA: TlpA disulfide reductase family protein [Blastocatellia bacterium]|nr:TlpA disulfide reductase family protein [Blastocatellia bacterium]
MIRIWKSLVVAGSLIAVLCCSLAARGSGNQTQSKSGGPAATQLRAELLNPKTVEPVSAEEFRGILAHHRGEIVLVNLWATWCKPCIKELPDLVKLQRQYRDKKFTVIAVSFDDLEDLDSKVRPFAREKSPEFIHYLQKEDDPEKFVSVVDSAWEGIVPTNFLFDREGKLKGKLIGGKSYEDFETAITPLLNQ